MRRNLARLQTAWSGSATRSECSLHQLAPYIGKLKTSIARTLINEFSHPGEKVFDPFSGSGVVPLESLLLGRSVIANDLNPYAAVLTRAKLFPLPGAAGATSRAAEYIVLAKELAKRRNYQVQAPAWVRDFYHPRTLAEVKVLADLLLRGRQWFLLANLLGILHHQRPGFLSYPSSHLVPYLRSRRFPRDKYPEMYRYRDVAPRLAAKIARSYRRFDGFKEHLTRTVTRTDVSRLTMCMKADVAVTSPPYMNALDYGRDNRLRLWFLGVSDYRSMDRLTSPSPTEFHSFMVRLGLLLSRTIRPRGRAVLVVGEVRKRRLVLDTDRIVRSAFEDHAGGWKLASNILDFVPDVRRSRRECHGTKREWIMIFERTD
ncbi:MAG: hypothetical protein A3G20_00690 [Acidobacteria bacterium RIFCSPLOWO2_12_FULL_59_11]|nr:MAG: hypothetical protein A3G20_00690 [Acidobacteria bacterium RIFCSPLOWO2_12_FULL_59_11]